VGVSINGDNITITNATIDIINGNNPESGVVYIVITPEGGVGVLPFMAQGDPGQPTLFPVIELEQVPHGDPLPTPNPEKTLLDPGGPGQPAKYALKFYLNAGADGQPGVFNISGAADLSATPGAGHDKFVLEYRHSDGKWVPSAQRISTYYASGTINATAYGNTNPRQLSSISVPAMPWNWRPIVFAATTVTGTDGDSPTRVDLIARLGNADSGDVLGYGRGVIGANTIGVQTVIIPNFAANQAVPGSYGRVASGAAADIYLRAEQVNPTTSSWSTPASPDTSFGVLVLPVS